LLNIPVFTYYRNLAKVVFCGLLALPLLARISGADAASFQLKPHKDKLFKYRKAIKTEDNGLFVRAPYDPLRDINARDEVPVRKVKTYYTSSRPARHQLDLSFKANGRDVTYFGVGALEGPSNMTVIFVHGRDGSRHLGFSDEKFGGNFNRVKSLMYYNGGIYLSTDITDFKEKGRQDVAALIKKYRAKTKGPMVVACGSMGSHICWRLANVNSSARMIDGIVIMGGFPNDQFLQKRRNKSAPKIPVYIAHGGIDYVYSWEDQKRFYQGLRKAGNPVRYVVFDGGKHGTPVRMIDWRLALNWIAEN